MIKIAHIADIHYRGVKRHKEYKEVFVEFFNKCKELNTDYIVIGGDIFHTKTQGITPEVIDELSWFFTKCSETCKTYVLLGNHDGNLRNLGRQDAISPIINALNLTNLVLLKDTKSIEIEDNVHIHAYSCFDTKAWKKIKPINNDINIALFHGSVGNAITDTGFMLEPDVDITFFNGHDYVLLGDIHKHQFLTPDKRIAYPGSPIPQNYSEIDPKGFLFWEIENKETFNVTFHELKKSYPFVTLGWCGSVSETLEKATNYKNGSRFRITCDHQLTLVEIKQLHSELKLKKQASEIVWKFNKEFNRGEVLVNNTKVQDLRNYSTQIKLLKEHNKNYNLTDSQNKILESYVKQYVNNTIKNDLTPRNVKWSIKKMSFDNTFKYGKNNVIDFNKLGGITGIFANNRSGKSSIIGTIMYGLFNMTDRGSLKNIDIINARKAYCSANIELSINDKDYIIERKSSRRQNRKKQTEHATTELEFYQQLPDGTIKNLNGLQRSDTDKQIRNLIGDPEHFLITSLSSQGDMNRFIYEGASYRKSILAKFLGLDVFEKMFSLVKADSDELKYDLKKFADRDWGLVINEFEEKKKALTSLVDDETYELNSFKDKFNELNVELVKLQSGNDIVTRHDVNNQQDVVDSCKGLVDMAVVEIDKINKKYHDINKKLNSSIKSKQEIKIDELRDKLDKKNEIEKLISNLRQKLSYEKNILTEKKNSIKILDTIPCGDKYPTCVFIKNSHIDKKHLPKQQKLVSTLIDEVEANVNTLHEYIESNITHSIQQYNEYVETEKKLTFELSDIKSSRQTLEHKHESLLQMYDKENDQLSNLKKKLQKSKNVSKLMSTKQEIEELKRKIKNIENKLLNNKTSLNIISEKIIQHVQEKKDYLHKKELWSIFEILLNAYSKKGIPAQVISSQLPLINQEISNILHGTCDFTVTLELKEESNNIELYIDYGDSRRKIETGSGMEKSISSLALRVALLNISSLPKTNMFIIDEGFGVLDENNLEACNRFLISLKRFFKNIVLISHIDSVKDTVDNLLEITSSGANSKVVYE